jgi:hypothetical protein
MRKSENLVASRPSARMLAKIFALGGYALALALRFHVS